MLVYAHLLQLTADQYSSHSLRCSFANWATSNGRDLKTLMEYVGWKDVHSAMCYVDGGDPFGGQGIAQGAPPVGSTAALAVRAQRRRRSCARGNTNICRIQSAGLRGRKPFRR